MALALNKSSLKQQRDQLGMFRRFLPSLDLKRQQLLGSLKQARQDLAAAEAEVEELAEKLEPLYPLLGSEPMMPPDLSQLLQVSGLEIDEENVVGARLPRLKGMQVEIRPYSILATPFWVDNLVDALRRMARLHLNVEIGRVRLERLEVASRRITQRVNLFEKVLIPQAVSNIRRIQVFMSDEERAAVVRSKIAKRKPRR